MSSYLNQPAGMDPVTLWDELAEDGARPVVHVHADTEIVHVHLLGDAATAYIGPGLREALAAAVTEWRRAKILAAIEVGLLDPGDADTVPADEVALAAAAALALRDLTHR